MGGEIGSGWDDARGVALPNGEVAIKTKLASLMQFNSENGII